jgi:hypothetical protein
VTSASRANAASKIGTAPLETAPGDERPGRPAQTRRSECQENHQRPRYQSKSEREHDALEPDATCQPADVDRQAKRDEDHELGETRERAREALDFALEWHARVPQEKAGDEDGEEPRPVRERGHPVQGTCEDKGQHRVQPLAREPQAAKQRKQSERSQHPVGCVNSIPLQMNTLAKQRGSRARASTLARQVVFLTHGQACALLLAQSHSLTNLS